jgi:hypothetical protein
MQRLDLKLFPLKIATQIFSAQSMIYLYRLVAVAASEGVELSVATGSLYLFLSEKVRLLGRNTVIMVVKYDYRQERVKWQQKKRMAGT